MRNYILKVVVGGCAVRAAHLSRAPLREAHSAGSLAGTEWPQHWDDGTHSQSHLEMGALAARGWYQLL